MTATADLLHLDDPVTRVEGVGPAMAKRLADALGIRTVRDLLEHYPRRYRDAGDLVDWADATEGDTATLLGEVLGWEVRDVPPRGRRRRMTILTGRVRQADGAVFSVVYFNQRYRTGQLAPGTVAAFSGTVKRFRQDLQLQTPDTQVLGRVAAGTDVEAAAERLRHQPLLAVYPATEQVSSFALARLVEKVLDVLVPVTDWVPPGWLEPFGLPSLDEALRWIHRPPDAATAARARDRLVFDEVVPLHLGIQARRFTLAAEAVGLVNGPADAGLATRFLDALPWPPTGAQRQAFAEIGADLSVPRPMHRLLQGDVGSGKTVVALWTMLCAVDAGRQAALMVPTEVLAEQHHRTVQELLAPLGVNVLDGVRVELLTSSTTQKERRRILGELLSGRVDLLVGTHALLEEGVRFADLGVVVIDEQHRFGVSQRVRLKEKASDGAPHGTAAVPDVLVMTATPIPRSLALTTYGDLDVTALRELPPGRTPVTTQVITPAQAARRDRVYDFVRDEVAAGRRAFVVCPFVDTAELPGATAVEEHARLSADVFPDLRVELLHGRMRPADKEVAMDHFRRGDAQVLVTTTVIEVGVDVPEASVMIIEDAERFGISQLHQLRGRVGRGADRSWCVLFAGWRSELTDDGEARLEAVARTTDGFALAEVDLDIRGEGRLFGTLQSGRNDLKLTEHRRDAGMIERTRELARDVIARDPHLEAPEHDRLRAEVERRHDGVSFEALQAG